MAVAFPSLIMSDPHPRFPRVGHFVALGCATVVLIFGGFELLERLWLAPALTADTMHWLHLARGLLATLAVGSLATTHLLRRPSSPFPPGGTPDELERDAGRRRVEWFVRLRWLAIVAVAGASVLATQVMGLLSPAAFPPLLTCLALLIAAILFGPTSARRFALGSWSLFAAASLAEAAGWLVGPECAWAARVSPPGLALVRLVPLLGVLLLTAYLISVIMEELRRRERQWGEAARTAAEARAQLESVVRAAGLALLVLDADVKIVWSNDRAREWFGEEGARVGRSCLICKSGNGADCFS